MLHGKNQTVYGECLALSDEFISKFYNKSDKEIVAEPPVNKYIVTVGLFEGHIFNGHPVVISGEDRIWDDDSVGRSYPAENTKVLSEINEASIKISSKQELLKLGYASIAPGIYVCSKHHLWQLSRDGEGYVIERTVDEETIRKAKETKIASRLTTKSDMPLDDFSNDLDQSGVYYQKGSSSTDTESGKLVTSFEVEDKDLDTFKTIASDYGIIVEANKIAEIEESKKVFSDEAIIRGISLLLNMGFTKNEAIKEFIASNELANEYKKEIENILDKYKIQGRVI